MLLPLNQNKEVSKLDIAGNELFKFNFQRKKDFLLKRPNFEEDAKFKQDPKHETFVRKLNDASNYLSYVLGRNIDQDLDLPLSIFINLEKKQKLYDYVPLDDNEGLTLLEKAIKFKYKDKDNFYGYLSYNIEKSTLENSFEDTSSFLTNNQLDVDLFPINLIKLSRFLGFTSNIDENGFKYPLTTFDKHLYSKAAGRFVVANDKFQNLDKKCTFKDLKSCEFYFVGTNVSRLLENIDESSYFKIDASRYGIPVSFNKGGLPFLNLRNTLLAFTNYKNYGSFTELELALLQDLGYLIDTKKFFGKSIYSFGAISKKIIHNLDFDFIAEKSESNSSGFLKIPYATGLHIYGSNNRVTYKGKIRSKGKYVTGIRSDGSNNNIYIDKNASIKIDGERGVGLALFYGKDNKVYIDGEISSIGSKGIGILASYGSNIFSDLEEYRGSYQRSQSKAITTGKYTKEEGTHLPLFREQNGPIANFINIKGSVIGNKSAILIDDSALVREINLFSGAKIFGGIYSSFSVNESQAGELYNLHAFSDKFYLPVIQGFKNESLNERKKRFDTTINFGYQEKDGNIKYDKEGIRVYDDKASAKISGNIIGKKINLNVARGNLNIEGVLRVNDITVGKAHLYINSDGKLSSFNNVKIKRGGIVDFTNNKADDIIVDGDISVSPYATIRIDTDELGNPIDNFIIRGDFLSRTNFIKIEPAVPYTTLKSLQSSPALMLEYLSNFVQKVNTKLADFSLYTGMPEYIWYSDQRYGRQIKCSVRGCRVGEFKGPGVFTKEEIPLYRYVISIAGIFVMLLISYIYFKVRTIKANKKQ